MGFFLAVLLFLEGTKEKEAKEKVSPALKRKQKS
jgi:hypothetical protein